MNVNIEDYNNLQERLLNNSPFVNRNAQVMRILDDLRSGMSNADLLAKYPDLRIGELQAMRAMETSLTNATQGEE